MFYKTDGKRVACSNIQLLASTLFWILHCGHSPPSLHYNLKTKHQRCRHHILIQQER